MCFGRIFGHGGNADSTSGRVLGTQRSPRRSERCLSSLTFVDLFAGIGGTRLGFEAAGGQCVFSSEWDKFAQRTYAANHGEWPAGDIYEVNLDEIPEHDVLVSGFPCQPFSIAGVSKLAALGRRDGFTNPEQGHLFFRTAEVLDYHRPRAFMLENVRNLVSHDRGRTFETIGLTLNALGYSFEWQVIDAANLVPQHRERIYIVGFRDRADLDLFEWPTIDDLKPRLRNVLEPATRVDPKYTLSDRLWEYLQGYAAKHRARGNGFGFGLPDLEGVSRTLSARYYKDGSEILISQPGQNPRRLTPRECARLMGFPEQFVIPVSDTQAYKQFGNSVVVPVVAAIAKAQARALGHTRMRGQRLKSWRPRTAPPLVSQTRKSGTYAAAS